MSDMAADPLEMLRQSSKIMLPAQILKEINDAHEARLSEVRRWWGDDETGKAFEEQLAPAEETHQEMRQALDDGFVATTTATADYAHVLHATEMVNSETARGVLPKRG